MRCCFQNTVMNEGRLNPDALRKGNIPMLRKTNNPPPAELFAQFLGRKDLIYYDWEITQDGVLHARQMWQLLDILQHRNFPPDDAPTVKWLAEAGPLLGNTISEVSQSGPKELTLIRKSHIGLTGFEILALTRWFDSPGFPFSYEPPGKIKPRERPPETKTKGKATAPRTNVVNPSGSVPPQKKSPASVKKR